MAKLGYLDLRETLVKKCDDVLGNIETVFRENNLLPGEHQVEFFLPGKIGDYLFDHELNLIHAMFERFIELTLAVLHLALNLSDLGLELPAFYGESIGGENGTLVDQFLIGGP
jgi:hypothetical protein